MSSAIYIPAISLTDCSAEENLFNCLLEHARVGKNSRLKFLQKYIYDVSDLTLLHEQDLIDAGMLPMWALELRQVMRRHGLSFLDPRQNRLQAMIRYYGNREDVPLRLLFFGSPLVGRLKYAGIVTLGQLLRLTLFELATVKYTRGVKKPKPYQALDRFEAYEIEILLDLHSLRLRSSAAR